MNDPVKQKLKPILLLGAYGRGNAGDDVFLHCALELFPKHLIYINSADNSLLPPLAADRVQTIPTAIFQDVVKKVRLYLTIREVVYWGGDLWVELYGTKRPRQLLYKMVILNILLRLTGKNIYYIGCGIGKLSGYSLWLAQLSAKLAKKIVVREHRSARVLNLSNVKLISDLAVNLPYHQPALHTLPPTGPFKVVIAILRGVPDPDINFPRMIQDISNLISSMPADRFQVSLLPMHVTDKEPYDDLWASKELQKLQSGRKVDIINERDLEKTIAYLRDSHLVIAGRLHAGILATLNATPSLGISYRPKVRAFFDDNGLSKYCLEIENTADLQKTFWEAYNNYNEIAERFYEVSKRNLEKRADYQKLADEM